MPSRKKQSKNRKRRSIESTESTPSDEPSRKRRRIFSHNNDSDNHNDNDDDHNDPKKHHHFQKFQQILSRITPYSTNDISSILNNDDIDDNDMIIGDNFDLISNASSNAITRSTDRDSEIRLLKRRIYEKNREIQELYEKLKIVKRIATTSMEPKYGDIAINKTNGIASTGIHLVKEKILRRFASNTLMIQINEECSNGTNNEYKAAIRHFLKKNKNITDHAKAAENPFIAISKKQSKKKKKSQSSKFIWKQQRDLFELRMENELRRNQRINQNELDKVMDDFRLYCGQLEIMRGTVIGEYIGLQLTTSEFEEIYGGSYVNNVANLYAYEQTIDLDDIDHILIEDEDEEDEEDSDHNHNHHKARVKSENKEHDEYDDEDEDGEETQDEEEDIMEKCINDITKYENKFIVDPLGFHHFSSYDHLLMFAADCRDHVLDGLSEDDLKEEEVEKLNIEMVTAIVNGWPRIFAITNRVIKPNEAICGYFGKKFTAAKYQGMKGKLARARMTSYIDSILDMNLFMPDS